jgi:hypothetical protein
MFDFEEPFSVYLAALYVFACIIFGVMFETLTCVFPGPCGGEHLQAVWGFPQVSQFERMSSHNRPRLRVSQGMMVIIDDDVDDGGDGDD